MTTILVLRNDASVPPGRLADVLDAQPDVDWRLVKLDEGAPVPTVGEADGFVILGGQMGAYDTDEFPYLTDEKALVVAAASAGTPVLGICLGCQVAADALGGSAFLADSLEARYAGCTLTAVGADDAIVAPLSDDVLSLHQDTWTPPPGAAVLAVSDRYPQAFRSGSIVGIQPHPEVRIEDAEAWVTSLGPDRIAAAGADPDALLATLDSGASRSADTAHAVFGAWIEEVRASADPAEMSPQ